MRLTELQKLCGLIEKSDECVNIVREIVMRNLTGLKDPEWSAGYRLLYQDVLK